MSDKSTNTGKKLERWVADCYRKMGAVKAEHDVELAGNQIDVYVEMRMPDESLHRIAIEAKDLSPRVGKAIVNDFAAIAKLLRDDKLIDEGIIVSSKGFTKPARTAAKAHAIRLLEKADLEAMLAASPEGPKLADEGEYRKQVAAMSRELDFVGIPELKERRAITLEDIFIRLRAAPSARAESVSEFFEALREVAQRGDEASFARLSQESDRLAHGVRPDTPVSVEEGLRQSKRVAILGDPGAGKTVFLKYVTVICAEGRGEAELGLKADGESALMPIFIPLR